MRRFLAAAGYEGTGVWERTGMGPTWTELADELRWPPRLRDRIIRLLARDNMLTYSPEPRSLAVGVPGAGDVDRGEPG